MSPKQAYRTSCAAVAIVALLQNAALAAGGGVLIPAGATGSAGAAQYRDVNAMTGLSTQAKIALLRQKVKYVFVIFQENRSFDHYFGTYPGANGLFDASGKLITSPNSGTTQAIRKYDGSYTTISPFLIPSTVQDANGATVQIYPEDTASVDHAHTGMVYSAHFAESTRPVTAQNDGYALDEEKLKFATGTYVDPTNPAAVQAAVVRQSDGTAPAVNPTLGQYQMAELTMGHLDCNTIPFLWNYADRFTMFDNFHQTTIGPSTPNAIAMIAGQTGETQWALHNSTAGGTGISGSVPVTGDSAPFPGSKLDTSAVKPAWGPDENPASPQGRLTFASLPLSFMGNKIGQIIAQDQNPAADLLDVQHDIWTVASKDANVNWGWYQQGFGPESFDGTNLAGGAYYPGCNSSYVPYSNAPGACLWQTHASYIVHHNGPQYFGYLGDNKTELTNMHGLSQFFTDVASQALPAAGGVFYVRGGYANNDGLTPLVPNNNTTPHQQADFAGNDDHPSYSDAMISEALVADAVNAIASSPYWNQSAIIITYDETDGMYDHAPQNIRSWDPTGYPLTGGPRIPAIVISPYSAVHTVSTRYSEHGSVIRFIDEVFGLVPLANLPDEQRGRALGHSTLGQDNLGPADGDGTVSGVPLLVGDLLEAFDNDRLQGNAPPLPPSYATIPQATILSLPHYGRAGCSALGITPTDYPNGLSSAASDPAPADFNPRPGTAPGIPAQGVNPTPGSTTFTPASLRYPWQP